MHPSPLRWRNRLNLLEIFETPTIKEASKTEKLKEKFRPARMRTRAFIDSFSLRTELGSFRPLYLLKEHPTRKKQERKMSFLGRPRPPAKFRPRPPHPGTNIRQG